MREDEVLISIFFREETVPMTVVVVVVVTDARLRDGAAGADDFPVFGGVLEVHLSDDLREHLVDVDPVLGAGLHERAAPDLGQSLKQEIE